MACNTKITM